MPLIVNGTKYIADDVAAVDDLIAGDDLTVADDATIGGDVTMTAGGTVTTTANGNYVIKPHGSGITVIGDAGSTSHSLNANDDLHVTGEFESDGPSWFDSTLAFNSYLYFSAGTPGTYGCMKAYTDDGVHFYAGNGNGQGNHHIIVSSYTNANKDHDHDTISTDPSIFIHSILNPDTRNCEFATLRWNEVSISGTYGSYCGTKVATEEVTIAVGQGAAGVATSGNLCPANSYIKEILTRVTQAPGGGATTLDAGRTAGGNLDEATDGTAVTLNTTTMANNDGDGATTFPVWEAGADTVTLTTDVNVTVTDMKVRVTVYYEEYTAHTG